MSLSKDPIKRVCVGYDGRKSTMIRAEIEEFILAKCTRSENLSCFRDELFEAYRRNGGTLAANVFGMRLGAKRGAKIDGRRRWLGISLKAKVDDPTLTIEEKFNELRARIQWTAALQKLDTPQTLAMLFERFQSRDSERLRAVLISANWTLKARGRGRTADEWHPPLIPFKPDWVVPAIPSPRSDAPSEKRASAPKAAPQEYPEGMWIYSKYQSWCRTCFDSVDIGARVLWTKGKRGVICKLCLH